MLTPSADARVPQRRSGGRNGFVDYSDQCSFKSVTTTHPCYVFLSIQVFRFRGNARKVECPRSASLPRVGECGAFLTYNYTQMSGTRLLRVGYGVV